MADRKPLKPAKLPSEGERAPYLPRLPWKWIGLGGLVLAILIGFFWLRHTRTVEGLRAEIRLARNEAVAPAAERVQRFRERIEGWITEAAEGGAPEPWADPGFSFANLHDEQGVYLRIPEEQAHSAEAIAEAAQRMGPDAIARCLGLTPTSLQGLYTRLEPLDPAWMSEVETADGTMRLRVLEDELHRYIRRDLPILLHTLQSDYFLLVLEHGPDRSKSPVDIYLWDLEEGRLLLRTRARGKGILLPVRIGMGDAPRTAGKPPIRSGGAVDCAIAAQAKAVAGDEPLSVGSRTSDRLAEEAAEQEAAAKKAADEKAADEKAADKKTTGNGTGSQAAQGNGS